MLTSAGFFLTELEKLGRQDAMANNLSKKEAML